MSMEIEKFIAQGDMLSALKRCIEEKQYWLGLLLCKFSERTDLSDEYIQIYSDLMTGTKNSDPYIHKLPIVTENYIEPVQKQPEENNTVKYTRVLLLCNWCDSKTLCNLWNKMSQGNYFWNNIRIVWEEPCDYYVVINAPPIGIIPDPRKTIYFSMEPNAPLNTKMWGSWADPKPEEFFYCGTHKLAYNNNEWHLSKTYTELSSEPVIKDPSLGSILSTVISDKYKDPGHVKRIDFVKFLDNKGVVPVHVFGGNKYKWKTYKGSPPSHSKDEAMFPYKYVFNAENFQIRNYYTEKLIDGILAECLVFYWGCPNIRDFIDERAYVQLDLIDFAKNQVIIKEAIEGNLWEKRLEYIQAAKKSILETKQFFPRLERIIQGKETTKKST